MILVREVFQLKFGKAKDAKALMLESKSLMTADQVKRSRILFDLTGQAYTMVLEIEHDNLAAFENDLTANFAKPEWGPWYQKFIPLIENSRREIFTIMDFK